MLSRTPSSGCGIDQTLLNLSTTRIKWNCQCNRHSIGRPQLAAALVQAPLAGQGARRSSRCGPRNTAQAPSGYCEAYEIGLAERKILVPDPSFFERFRR